MKIIKIIKIILLPVLCGAIATTLLDFSAFATTNVSNYLYTINATNNGPGKLFAKYPANKKILMKITSIHAGGPGGKISVKCSPVQCVKNGRGYVTSSTVSLNTTEKFSIIVTPGSINLGMDSFILIMGEPTIETLNANAKAQGDTIPSGTKFTVNSASGPVSGSGYLWDAGICTNVPCPF